MITAGIRLFTDGGAPLLRSLTAGMVAQEAGFHRQTFYRHWETQDDFMGELIERVFTLPEDDEDLDTRRGDGRGAASFEESVRGLARREFDNAQRDPAELVRLGLRATGQVTRGEVAVAAAAFNRLVQGRMVAQYADLLAEWDRRPRPPLQVDDLVSALRAQLAGTFMTLDARDAAAGRRQHLRAALALVTAMTEPCAPQAGRSGGETGVADLRTATVADGSSVLGR